MSENDLIPQYNMIRKIEWTERSNGDQLILFSDGLPASGCSMRDAITVIKNNKLKTIIEMKDKIIDFFLVDSSPWTSENPPDPSAVIVLLETNLVVIDLRTEGYPQFDHHHPISLHESPVSMCQYMVEPNPAFYRNLNELKAKENQLKQTTTQKIQTELVPGATASEPFYSKEVGTNKFSSKTFFFSLGQCLTKSLTDDLKLVCKSYQNVDVFSSIYFVI